MSFLFLEIKYAKMVGVGLERWKVKKEHPFHGNSRCPVCGDSAKSKSLCRFHIKQADDTLFVRCFNCDYSVHLTEFLKVYHPGLFSEFIFERYRIDGKENTPIITTPKVAFDDAILIPTRKPVDQLVSLDLPFISDLPETHPVARYVASRKLPTYPFQLASKFYEFASQYNEELKESHEKIAKDEPRLIIPFFDRQGNVFAFQGRDLLGKSAQKYITIIINKKIPKIFGIDRIDFKKPIQIVEGPIDSLFLNNCLASVNASLVSTAEKLKTVINKNLVTLIYDAEPRNKEICKMYQTAISAGYRVVIWPSGHGEKVDINDLVKLGIDPQKIIDQNTYSGLSAQIHFDRWKKI